MFKMEMQWKECSVDLGALDTSLRASYPSYKGNQAHRLLELWFDAEPVQADKDAIQALWDGIDANHAMAKSYKSQEDLNDAMDAKRDSAKKKLKALGLSEAELKAILG